MNPWQELGTACIPNDGGELVLAQRDQEFSIHLKGVRGELMNSRTHSSELALAELGCAHLAKNAQAQVLVGGMGMGFTLAAALKATPSTAKVVVAELVPEVLAWNKGPLGACAGYPLNDLRTEVHLGDVAALFEPASTMKFDAILLDVDNGPEGFTHADNTSLYSLNSLGAMASHLKPGGVIAVWSGWHDPKFTTQLKKAGFKAETKTVRAHKGKGSRHTIYLAKKP